MFTKDQLLSIKRTTELLVKLPSEEQEEAIEKVRLDEEIGALIELNDGSWDVETAEYVLNLLEDLTRKLDSSGYRLKAKPIRKMIEIIEGYRSNA